ncbi:MAG: hypothetical protein HY674_15110 [Chloroflexi bacterium]|nr:hypothetical protein [Chloroflexota bacterium]
MTNAHACLLLRRVMREPPGRDVIQEPPQQTIAAEVFIARQKVVKIRGRRARILLRGQAAEKEDEGLCLQPAIDGPR